MLDETFTQGDARGAVCDATLPWSKGTMEASYVLYSTLYQQTKGAELN